jgi:hypothetical protein
MKFRTIYLLFNVVIAVSFVFVFLLPFALLGWEYSVEFWKGSWYLALFFLLLLGILNAFFVLNWRIFSLVEKEDWSGLTAHLVELVFVKKRYGSRHLGLLVDAYLLQGDVGGIERLEEELTRHRPALLRKSAVLFGLTRLLRDRPAEAAAFLEPLLGKREVDNWEWLRFDYAFALVLQRRFAEAQPQLLEGASSSDPVLALLAAYLLATVIVEAGLPAADSASAERAAESVRLRLARRFPGERLGREIERARGEFQVVILSKLIGDARAWLSSNPRKPGPA